MSDRLDRPGPPRLVMQLLWKVHRLAYRLSGGRLAPRVAGAPNLLLRTTGRRSRERRETILSYLDVPPNLVVIASNAGSERHPGWWLNLEAHPEAEVRVGDEWRAVRARRASESELADLLPRIDALNPIYGRYRAAARRRSIPVVVLEPRH